MAFQTPRSFGTFTGRVQGLGAQKGLNAAYFDEPVGRAQAKAESLRKDAVGGEFIANDADALSNDAATGAATGKIDAGKIGFTGAGSNFDSSGNFTGLDIGSGSADDIVAGIGNRTDDATVVSQVAGGIRNQLSTANTALGDTSADLVRNQAGLVEQTGEAQTAMEKAVGDKKYQAQQPDYSSQGIINALSEEGYGSNIGALSQFFGSNNSAYEMGLNSGIYDEEMQNVKAGAKQARAATDIAVANQGAAGPLLAQTKKVGMENIGTDMKDYVKSLDKYFQDEEKKVQDAIVANEAAADKAIADIKPTGDAQANDTVSKWGGESLDKVNNDTLPAVQKLDTLIKNKYPIDGYKEFQEYLPDIDMEAVRSLGIGTGTHGQRTGETAITLAKFRKVSDWISKATALRADYDRVLAALSSRPGYAGAIAALTDKIKAIDAGLLSNNVFIKSVAGKVKKWEADLKAASKLGQTYKGQTDKTLINWRKAGYNPNKQAPTNDKDKTVGQRQTGPKDKPEPDTKKGNEGNIDSDNFV